MYLIKQLSAFNFLEEKNDKEVPENYIFIDYILTHCVREAG